MAEGPGPVTPEDRLAGWLVSGFAFMGLDPGSNDGIEAAIFDLDGVLVDTAEFHYQAWQRLADELQIPFDRQANEAFRGVSRMDCLAKLLGPHAHAFAPEEKKLLGDRKNHYYLALIENLSPADLLPGARELLIGLHNAGLKLGLVSASRNARKVLDLLEITREFDTIVDGSRISRSKPHPEGFLLAAGEMKVNPRRCVVIEDAASGIVAAHAAGMKTVALTQSATQSHLAEMADRSENSLYKIHVDDLNRLCKSKTQKIVPAA